MFKMMAFYDPVCPDPYTLETLENGSLGGTEASCLRIAEALANKGYWVWLHQRNRTQEEYDGTIVYAQLDLPLDAGQGDVVITLRDAGHYVNNVKTYPEAIHYLWLHDVVSGEYTEHMLHHLNAFNGPINVICVSDWHKAQILSALAPIRHKINIKRIYGPIPAYCEPISGSTYDPFKLIFTSSPHKGLDRVLDIFRHLYKKDKRYKLYLSNPGYFPDAKDLPEGVISLGSLKHRELIEQVRSSLCLFYPNTSFAETFGLVMAEAESVGTPVIAHSIGAAPEVISHRKSILDCNNTDLIVDTIIKWSNGERLIVNGNKQFTLKSVIAEWEKLLANS